VNYYLGSLILIRFPLSWEVSMARILTGIQSTGTPHLGNILGAILPAIEKAKDEANDSYLFIADLHSLTQIKEAQTLRHNTYSTAADMACFWLRYR
jgi:tryptophanyl-tRNA synthetase